MKKITLILCWGLLIVSGVAWGGTVILDLGSSSSSTVDNSTIDSRITQGTAAKALALNANGANCSSGQVPLGVDASGAVEGCWTPPDNATIDSRIDQDHASSAETITGSETAKSVTPKALLDALAAYTHAITTTAKGTFGSLSIGDGNFTVDEHGNITYRSAASTRTDDPQYVRLYEATSKGNKYRQIIAPSAGYTRGDFDNATSLALPPGMPITGAGYMSLLWPALGTGETESQGMWAYGLYSFSTITGMVKTTGTQVVSAAVAGTDYVAPGYLVSTQVDGHTTGTAITAASLYNSIIYNTGQRLTNVALTLPAAATGMSFTAIAGEGQSTAAYWRFTANTANTMCLDGVCGNTYVQSTQPGSGDMMRCVSSLAAATGVVTSATLAVGTNPVQVKTAAFTYNIKGVYYTKAAVDGTVPGDDVIPEDLYGAIALDIGIDGVIDVTEATANATGYATSALALAGLPTVATDHLRIGTVTAMKSDGAFTFGTTSLSAATVTEAYASTGVYTKGYIWDCVSLQGKWEGSNITAKEYHPAASATLSIGQLPFESGYLVDNLLCTDNCTLTMGFDCTAQNVGRSAVFMDDNATAPSQFIVRPTANNTILDYCTTAGKGVRIDKTDRSFLGLRCKQTGASTYNWVPYGQLGYHVCED